MHSENLEQAQSYLLISSVVGRVVCIPFGTWATLYICETFELRNRHHQLVSIGR